MNKKLWLVFIALIVLAGFVKVSIVRAQKNPELVKEEALERIEQKLDGLSSPGQNTKEISRKLDLILSNQEKILRELEIVKVRVSMKG